MTFDEWHKANAKYMEPVDIVDWCREAYEAGRKDENEACADEIYAEINDDIEDEAYCILVALLARIRARREQ